MSGKFLLIYICNFHVLSNLLLIFICKLHWNSSLFLSTVNERFDAIKFINLQSRTHVTGNLLLIYIFHVHVISNLLLNYIYKLHWNFHFHLHREFFNLTESEADHEVGLTEEELTRLQKLFEFMDMDQSGKFLLIFICNFHVLSSLLLIYMCKLHWNLNTMFVCQVIFL